MYEWTLPRYHVRKQEVVWLKIDEDGTNMEQQLLQAQIEKKEIE